MSEAMEGVFRHINTDTMVSVHNLSYYPAGNTTEAVNVTTLEVNENPDNDPVIDAANKVRVSFAFITLLVATIGNALTLAVMCRKSMRGTAAGVYLSAIAVADSFVVYCGQVPFIIEFLEVSIATHANSWSCSVRWFLLYTSADVAVWLIVALTMDRFIAVWLPHRAKALCTIKRAIIVCVLVNIAAVIKNFSILIGMIVTTNPEGKEVCGYREDMEHYMKFIRPWLAFTLYAFLPILTVFSLNLLIVHRLWQVHRAVKSNTQGTVSQRNSSSFTGSSLTTMFLSVSIVFLVLLTPAMLNYATLNYRKPTPTEKLVTEILDTMSYINHSINFFLYCLTARRFRAEFLGMVGSLCGRRLVEDRPSRNTTADLVSGSNLP